jgi:hypothetical protein
VLYGSGYNDPDQVRQNYPPPEETRHLPKRAGGFSWILKYFKGLKMYNIAIVSWEFERFLNKIFKFMFFKNLDRNPYPYSLNREGANTRADI